jgi:hypothetical protein
MTAMPSVGEDWQLYPLRVIDRLFEKAHREGTAKKGEWRVEQFFSERLAEKDGWTWVPSLNDVPLHMLGPNTLVRFRCMVQDIYDSEFYLGIYEVSNAATGEKVLRTGMYRDATYCQGESFDMNAASNVLFDRQTLYCVPIPGEAAWAKEAYKHISRKVTGDVKQFSGAHREKRRVDSEDGVGGEGEESMDTDVAYGPSSEKQTKFATQDTASSSSNISDSLPDLNFPLPEEKGPACLVKMYNHRDEFKVNDMVEVFGVFSVDPILAHFHDE